MIKKLSVYNAIDARQSQQWGTYLQSIGWRIKRVKDTQLCIREIPFFKHALIKVQHPVGPLPFKEMDKIAKEYRALFLLVEPHSEGYNEQDFRNHGFVRSNMHYAHSATIKIDLDKSEENLFKSFSENARRNIKKSLKNNLVVKTVWFKDDKNDKYFAEFYRLLMNLSKMKKFYSPSYDEYHKKMSAFKDTSIMLFAYEKRDNKPLAVIWLAYYGNIITYMQTGITTHGYEVLANYLLVWEGLKLAQKLNMKVFDFETMYDPRYPKENRDWIGYTEFKKRFHGTVIEYPPCWIKYYNPVAKAFFSFFSQFA